MTRAPRPIRESTRKPRRTPCVGICSTTYGDLVCRGCKRFAHEIVGWNTYTMEQRAGIEARLQRLKAGVVAGLLRISDVARCAAVLEQDAARSLGTLPNNTEAMPLELRAYEYLTRARTDHERQEMEPLPVVMAPRIENGEQLRDAVEAEFLSRSKAAYERSFKVSVD